MADVVAEIDGPVGIVRLDRPNKLNAVTFTMIAEIERAIRELAADERVTGIVVTASGRGFCAGLDLEDLARATSTGSGSSSHRDPEDLPALFSYILRIPKPVIAAVNGVAAGGGFVLAMMCDLRFAAEHGASFTTTFSKRGLISEHGTSWLLPRLVGTNGALDLLWSSRRIDAAEAHRMGFVDRVVPDDRLLEEACDYVRDLAANVSPRSLARTKALVLRGWSLPLREALEEVDSEMDAALSHPDATEGVASFVERRPPRFQPWTGGLL
ncbi:MAG: enoyl-CoA hydratase-related protein [Ilumatobacteraceae bacterium]